MATRVRAENSGWVTTEGFSLSSGWTSGNLLVVHIAHRSGVTAPDPPTVFVGSASAPMTFRGAATLDLNDTENRMGTYHYTRVIDGTEGTGQAITVSCTDRQHVVVAEEWNGLGAFVEFVSITDGTNDLFNNAMPTTSVLGSDAELLQYGVIKSGNGTPVNPAFTFSNAGNEYQFGPFAVDAYDCMGAIGSQSVTSGAAYTDTFNMDAQGAGTGHASFAGATLVYNAGAGNLGFSEVIARAYDAGEIEVDGVHASGGTVWWAVRDSADAQLTKSEILNGTGNAIANGTEAIGVISEFASGTALAAGTYVVDVYTDDGSTESDVQSTAPLTLNPIANVTQAVYKLEGAGGPVLPYAPLVDQWLVLLVSHRLGPPANEPAAYTYSENADALTFRGAVENEPLDLTHRSHVYVYARQIDGTEGTNRQINQAVSAIYGHAALVVAGDLDFAEVVGNTSGVAFGNTTLAAADTSALNPNSAALSIATFKQDSPTNAAAAAFDNATLLRNFVNGAPPTSLYIATGLRESAAGGVLSDSVTWSGADTANDALIFATLALEGPAGGATQIAPEGLLHGNTTDAPALPFKIDLSSAAYDVGDSFSIPLVAGSGSGYALELDGVDVSAWIDTESAALITGTIGELHLLQGVGDLREYGTPYLLEVIDGGNQDTDGTVEVSPPANTDNFILTGTTGIYVGDANAAVGDYHHGFKLSGAGSIIVATDGSPTVQGSLTYRYFIGKAATSTWLAPQDVVFVEPPTVLDPEGLAHAQALDAPTVSPTAPVGSGGVWLRQGDIGDGVRLATAEVVASSTVTITSLSPNPAVAGATVTIGRDNGAVNDTLTVDGVAVTPETITAQTITFLAPYLPTFGTPPSSRYNQPLSVVVANGGDSDSDSLTVEAAAGIAVGALSGYSEESGGPSLIDPPNGGNNFVDGDEYRVEVLSGAGAVDNALIPTVTAVPTVFRVDMYRQSIGEWIGGDSITVEVSGIALANLAHAHSTDAPATLEHNLALTVAELAHAQALDAAAVTGVLTPLDPAGLQHSNLLDSPLIGTGTPLSPVGLTHGTTVEDAALAAVTPIDLAGVLHALAIDAPALTVVGPAALDPAGVLHALTLDAPTITATGPAALDLAALNHSTTVDDANLSGNTILTGTDLDHAVTIESAALAAVTPLTVAGLSHAYQIDSPQPPVGTPLAIENLSIGVTVTSALIFSDTELPADRLRHLATLDAPSITGVSTPLDPAGLSTSYTLDAAAATGNTPLALADLQSVVAIDAIDLSAETPVDLAGLAHGHSVEAPGVTANTPLAVANLAHSAAVDPVVAFTLGLAPFDMAHSVSIGAPQLAINLSLQGLSTVTTIESAGDINYSNDLVPAGYDLLLYTIPERGKNLHG